MNPSAYYNTMKVLAREVRSKHDVRTDALGLREMHRIYRAEGIRIDRWAHAFRKVRAAYFVVDGESSVILNPAMKPAEPRLFSMAHELKHHYVDREQASRSPLGCQAEFVYGKAPVIEIGAEVFAAEFIFPEDEFREWADGLVSSKSYRPEDVVTLKRACPAKVSYRFLVKRLEWLGYCERGEFARVQFVKLEERLYGVPFYRRRYRRTSGVRK